ncbi:MAG: HlyC/CorC family transporter [Candidatus Marinimicrobia bacterium]|nr:HlyC/CorC family transporter [Candidatus Neomarinimicrobiota bacterium]
MTVWLGIIVILLCVICEGFFSGSEIAIVSIDRVLLQHKIKQGGRRAKIVYYYLKKPEILLGTTLVGTNLCTITSTTISAYIFFNYFGESGIPISIAIISFINWIFGEIVPKSIFQQEADTVTIKTIYVLRFFSILFYPIVKTFTAISAGINRIMSGKNYDKNVGFFSREELKIIMNLKGPAYTDIKPDERKMINRLLSFKEKEARDIMIPLIDVAIISEEATIDEAKVKFIETKHRRLPVYKERVYNIIGILNSFDILGEDKNKKINQFIRPAYYVPLTAKVTDILKYMQTTGNSMAIVVDEYGLAKGILTIEDILEEVVGDIEDEYDVVIPSYTKNPDGSITVKGKYPVAELKEKFEIDLPKGDYETISGFIIDKLKRIPFPGEKVIHNNYEFTIQRATKRAILEVKIKELDQK